MPETNIIPPFKTDIFEEAKVDRNESDVAFRLQAVRLAAPGVPSVASAAKKAGIAASTLRSAETGRRPTSATVLAAIARVFATREDYIAFGHLDKDDPDRDRRTEKIVRALRLLRQIEDVESVRMGSRLTQARLEMGHRTAKAAAMAYKWAIATYVRHEGGGAIPIDRLAVYAAVLNAHPTWLAIGILPEGVSSPLPLPEAVGSIARRDEQTRKLLIEARENDSSFSNQRSRPYDRVGPDGGDLKAGGSENESLDETSNGDWTWLLRHRHVQGTMLILPVVRTDGASLISSIDVVMAGPAMMFPAAVQLHPEDCYCVVDRYGRGEQQGAAIFFLRRLRRRDAGPLLRFDGRGFHVGDGSATASIRDPIGRTASKEEPVAIGQLIVRLDQW